MDLSPVIINIIKTFWYFIPLLILIGIFKTPWFKGFIGEVIVNCAIRLRLEKDKYHLFKNVTLPTEDGTTQIDHILVSQYGIFVIGTKNMKGWIFGSQNQKQWTQKIFKYTGKFQNPLHQNYKHTKALASCLDIRESKIFSVIVFTGDSEFKISMPDNVTYAGGLIRFIKSKQEVVLSSDEGKLSIEKIESGRLKPSIKTHHQHIQHVKEIQAKKKTDKICPECGSSMVLRRSKKGANAGTKFWGCKQFPKCHTTYTYQVHPSDAESAPDASVRRI